MAVVIIIIITTTFYSCENNPNDLGIQYVPADDTTGVYFLDSEIDTMNITSNNYKLSVNDYLANIMLVGKYQSYDSKTLLKFYQIPTDLDSSTIVSASLKLRYSNYYFKDKTGLTDFNVYKVISDLNYATITADSISPSDFGSKTLGNYSGVVADSASISFPLENNLIKDWLEYAADTSYINKNYGIAMFPNFSSTTIKGFYLLNDDVNYIPTINVIFTKNGMTDTLVLNTSLAVSINDAPLTSISPGTFLLQNGIAFRSILNFDLTKLPSNIIINNALLQFTTDKANSFISENAVKSMIIGMVTDSVNKKDSVFNDAFLLDSIVYSVSLNSVFQRWSNGVMPNLGITIRNIEERKNIDNYSIFSPTAADITKRPRLKITYTPRR